MNSYEMIARYVNAVVRRLPVDVRADVSAELNALLIEELEAKSSGDVPTEATARALLTKFGAPDAAALNYHTPMPVIDPRDVRLFGKLAVVILSALVILAISVVLSDPTASEDSMFAATIAGETIKAALQCLGTLLVVFWGVGLVRRRMPQDRWATRALRPVRDPNAVNRMETMFSTSFWMAGLAVLVTGPANWIARIMGESVPASLLEAFAYDDVFAAERAPFLWVALAVAIAMYAWPAFAGRRTQAWRRVDAIVTLVISAVLFQIVLTGDVFAAEPANEYMKLAMALTGGWGLIEGVSVLRRGRRVSGKPSALSTA